MRATINDFKDEIIAQQPSSQKLAQELDVIRGMRLWYSIYPEQESVQGRIAMSIP